MGQNFLVSSYSISFVLKQLVGGMSWIISPLKPNTKAREEKNWIFIHFIPLVEERRKTEMAVTRPEHARRYFSDDCLMKKFTTAGIGRSSQLSSTWQGSWYAPFPASIILQKRGP
jgi:hypothetical protein